MYIQPKSISSKPRYFTSSRKNAERRLRLMNSQVQDLLESYNNKKIELQKILIEERKEAQKLDEEREGHIREVNSLGETKQNLATQVDGLQSEKIQETKNLQDVISSKSVIIEKSRKALEEEKEKLEFTRSSLEDITSQAIDMEKIAKELREYVEKESEARTKYIIEREKLDKAVRIKESTTIETSAIVKSAKEKNERLDDYKEKITDMSGRLTTTLGYVRKVTEDLNERLKKVGADFEFELPPEKIKVIQF